MNVIYNLSIIQKHSDRIGKFFKIGTGEQNGKGLVIKYEND